VPPIEPIAWDGPLPQHLAVILDGNGRWAQQQGLSRVEGHRAGAQSVRMLVRSCRNLGIQALTVYAFSAQNWKRPSTEVMALMRLLYDYTCQERAEILANGIRFNCVGDLESLPSSLRNALNELMEASANNSDMVLSLAVSYGGREELIRAARSLAARAVAGEIDPSEIDEALLNEALWTRGLPPNVDLVIRTGGELRLSNFLLWQIAYAELWFTDAFWPDFGYSHLAEALTDFGTRARRFGQVA
jgi:undecaprenyl diphosphate synthase